MMETVTRKKFILNNETRVKDPYGRNFEKTAIPGIFNTHNKIVRIKQSKFSL